MSNAPRHDRNLIIPIVPLVVFCILAILLRALVAPLIPMATVILSVADHAGLSAFVCTHVFGFAGEDSAPPLYIFVFLVALGIDDNIFLMTRVRQELKRSGTVRGVLTALAATGGVITSAGFVLAGTFAVLATMPLITFAEVGFSVAFGVLLDTIVARSVLVTALNLEIGDHTWWPGGLHKGPAGPDEVPDERALVHHGLTGRPAPGPARRPHGSQRPRSACGRARGTSPHRGGGRWARYDLRTLI